MLIRIESGVLKSIEQEARAQAEKAADFAYNNSDSDESPPYDPISQWGEAYSQAYEGVYAKYKLPIPNGRAYISTSGEKYGCFR